MTVAATAVLTLVIAACGSGGDDGLPPPASPQAVTEDDTPTLNLSPAEQEAVEEARALIDIFFDAYVEEAVIGEPLETDMGRVIGGRPLEHTTGEITQDIQREFVAYREDEVVFEGDFEWEFVDVDDIELDRVVNNRNVPSVSIRYCVDRTTWVAVEKESGERSGEPGDRSLTTIRAVWYDDGDGTREEGWRIAGWEDHEGQSC